MKAWQLTQNGEPVDVLVQAEIDAPQLKPGHVVFKVLAVTLALPDALMCRGNYAYKPVLPCTPGQEFVGEVLSVADDVSEFKPGDCIAGVSAFYEGNGAFAEQGTAMAHTVFPIDHDIPLEQAAAFVINYHTAYVGLVLRGQLQADENLLVTGGAGGVGSAAIQLGKALGARVIASATGAAKVDMCRQLGADEVIDLSQQALVDTTLAMTNGVGANKIFDPVGGELYEQAFDCLANQGAMIAIGFASGRWGNTPLEKLVTKNCSVVGAMPAGYGRDEALAYHRELMDLLKNKKIHCLIDQVIGFEDIASGVQCIADRKTTGRIVALVGAQ